MLKTLLQMQLNYIKNGIPETAETTDDFIGNKITNKITENPPQNNSKIFLQAKEKSL